jgi:uncharacterized protein (DUF885 family)
MSPAKRSPIYDIADAYVEEMAALDPIGATEYGIAGHDAELTDFSPAGADAINALDRRTLQSLSTAPVENDADRIARDFMVERLALNVESHDAGEWMLQLRTIASPSGAVREVFDQMPQETEEHWANIAARLVKVPQALDSFRATLDAGIARGVTVAKRQATECAKQCETWAGIIDGTPPFFDTLVQSAQDAATATPALRADIRSAGATATAAFGTFARYLRDTYAPAATDAEACGRERYQRLSRLWNGITLDIDETYAWGWDELHRIQHEMQRVAGLIAPGETLAHVLHLLETDPSRAIHDAAEYEQWLQDLHDDAVRKLDGVHFDIDPRIRRIQVMIPPPGGALVPYYTGPSEDFSRPGRTWWPLGSRTQFNTWTDVTTAYHEGVPGHHLQIGANLCLDLSRFQRTFGWVSGHGEGWALYAERLMHELGFLSNPEHEMGMLSMQALRAARIVLDIGLHCQLPIPAAEAFHGGEAWHRDLALQFAVETTGATPEFLASEVDRYLGWPAQAISYKVGERVWLQSREAAKSRRRASFDLKQFHTQALALGPMGLEQMQREIARLD